MRQIVNGDIGYNKESTLVVSIPEKQSSSKAEAFLNELKKYPGIINGTIASVCPPNIGNLLQLHGRSAATGKDLVIPLWSAIKTIKTL